MPELVGGMCVGALVESQTATLPPVIVPLLGKAAGFAQAIEDLAFPGAGIKPRFRQTPQLRIGAVVETETPIALEDRDSGRDLVERVRVCVDVLLQFGFGSRQLR